MSIRKRSARNVALTALSLVSALSFSSETLAAGTFDNGIPAGWNFLGKAGTSGADGVVTLAPTPPPPAPPPGSQYGWVSTFGGILGVGLGDQIPPDPDPLVVETNGSTLTSPLFRAVAGDNLHFAFNFVTSDGAGYSDYAWAQLLDAASTPVALLFTARTTPNGDSVPGFNMPNIAATTTPATVVIPDLGSGPSWGPLGDPTSGGSSGLCYDVGCGYTGWVTSDYAIAATGLYFLRFGVINWSDTAYDTGLAFDGITVGGEPIVAVVPEPAALALLGIGLAGLVATRRRKPIA